MNRYQYWIYVIIKTKVAKNKITEDAWTYISDVLSINKPVMARADNLLRGDTSCINTNKHSGNR